MKKIKWFFKKGHNVITLWGNLLYGLAAFCAIYFVDSPIPLKIIACILLFVFIILVITYAVKKSKFGLADIIRLPPNKKGIDKLQPKDRANYAEITDQFSQAETLIRIIAYHGESVLSGTKEAIIEAMKRNVEVQLLIAKKESVMLKEVWELEGKNETDRFNETHKLINDIKKEAGEHGFKLKYHEFNTQARYALIAVDGKWAWWTPYHPGRRVENTTSIVLVDKGKESIIKDCLEHFDRVWNRLDEKEHEEN